MSSERTVRFSGPAGQAGVSTAGNTAGSTGTVSLGNLVLVGLGGNMLSQSTNSAGATVSMSVAAAKSLSFYMPPQPLLMAATQGIGNSGASNTTVTAWVQPMSVPIALAFNNLNLAAHCSFSSQTTSVSSINYSFSMGASCGFYSLNVSTMSLVTSFSGSLGYTNASSTNVTDMKMTARYGYGGSSTTKDTTGGANMSNIMSSINSVRKIPLNWTTTPQTLSGGQYWVVVAFSALTGGANHASLSQVGMVSSHSIIGSAFNPPEMMQNTASVTSPYPFLGLATLVNSSNSLMPVSFNTSNITTATAIANSTAFQSIWIQMFSSHNH